MGGMLLLLLRGSVAAMLIRRWACSHETDLLLFNVTAVDHTTSASSFTVTLPSTRFIFSLMMMMMMVMHSNFDIPIVPGRGGGRAR